MGYTWLFVQVFLTTVWCTLVYANYRMYQAFSKFQTRLELVESGLVSSILEGSPNAAESILETAQSLKRMGMDTCKSLSEARRLHGFPPQVSVRKVFGMTKVFYSVSPSENGSSGFIVWKNLAASITPSEVARCLTIESAEAVQRLFSLGLGNGSSEDPYQLSSIS